MFDKINDLLLSPLGSNHCMIFYVLMCINLFMIILYSLGILYIQFTNNKLKYLIRPGFIHVLLFAFQYYITRVTYSVCVTAYK